jgi:hypothetical protein
MGVSAIYELLYNPKFTPQRSSTGHIETLTVDGNPTIILTKESTREYFEVEPTTGAIWDLMDGKKTIKQIFVEGKKTDDTLTERDVRDVIISLAEEGLVESTEPEIVQKRVEMASTFQLDVNLVRNTSESLAWFFKATRKMSKKQVLPIAIGITVLGFALFAGTFVHIFSDSRVFNVAGSALLGIFFYEIIVLSPDYLLHELAHAAACDYYGGKPLELGTGLYYLAPFFYCNTSDSWRLGRRSRIMISLAGPLTSLVIASFFVFASYLTPAGFGRNVLQIAAFFGFYGTLVNFSPVIETDGYYILADVLNIPNLRDESLGFIKRAFLRKLGRPVSKVRQSARRRRIFLLYGVIAIGWFLFFGYNTFWLMNIYGTDAYRAISSLSFIILGLKPFDPVAAGLNVAAFSYFCLLMVGYGVMGVAAYKKIRVRGVKLETIHDKRVSVFLPIPSFFPRRRAEALVGAVQGMAGKFSRSFSVTWEPPLCVAAIKLGKVNESLDDMRNDMLRLEKSFKSLHYAFLSQNLNFTSEEVSAKKKMLADIFNKLAAQFPSFERREAIYEASQFLKRREDLVRYLLHSAFGTVWTLELSPGDYKRIRREIFPSLIAEDLGLTELPGELEHFKKYTVLGLDAISQLSSEVEQDAGKVHKNPEVFQVTAFLEPIKSRLVFVGRTEEVERSIVWLGGLFLYQAWTGYIGEALDEAALGLKAIRQAPSHSLSKTQIKKLSDEELTLLSQDFAWVETLRQTVNEAIMRITSTYESATNFHEMLTSLVDDESFDIGLYEPILRTNDNRLATVKDKVKRFKDEFNRVSDELRDVTVEINGEYSKRKSMPGSSKLGLLRMLPVRVLLSFRYRFATRRNTPTYEAGVKILFTTTRLVYDTIIGSDIVI